MSATLASVLVVGNTQRAVDVVTRAIAPRATLLNYGVSLLSHFLQFDCRSAEVGSLHVYSLRIDEYMECPSGFSDVLRPVVSAATDIVLSIEISEEEGDDPALDGYTEASGEGRQFGVPEALYSLLEPDKTKTLDSRLVVVIVPGPGEQGSLAGQGSEGANSSRSASVSSELLTNLVVRLQPTSVMPYDHSPEFSSRLRHLVGL